MKSIIILVAIESFIYGIFMGHVLTLLYPALKSCLNMRKALKELEEK